MSRHTRSRMDGLWWGFLPVDKAIERILRGLPTRDFVPYIEALGRNRRRCLVVFACMMASICLKLPMPLLTGYIIDTVIHNRLYMQLNIVATALIALTVLNLLLVFASDYLSFRIQKATAAKLSVRLLSHLQGAPLTYLGKHDSGYLQNRVMADCSQLNALVIQALNIAGNSLTFVVGIIAVYSLNVRLATLSLCIIPLFGFSLRLFSKRIQRLDQAAKEKQANISGLVTETFEARELTKLYNLGSLRCRRVRRAMIDEMRLSARSFRLEYFASASASFMAASGPLLVIWYGGHEVMAGRLTIGQLVAFSALLPFLFGPIRSFVGTRVILLRTMVSLRRIGEILSIEHEGALKAINAPTSFRDFGILLRKVSFAYESGAQVLNNLDLVVAPGESVAILGATGAGKSTVIKLLVKFYAPQSGSILIGGRDISELDPVLVRSYIGFIPQEPFLFSDSILENIRMGKPGSAAEEVIAAARQANAYDFVMSLPGGFDTQVGSNGARLSGGQRQLICIARAMLRNAPILIMDEPTSAVDSKTEQLVRDSLARLAKGRTTIVISHRPPTVSFVDRYVVLERGCVTDSGTYDKLVGHNGFHRDATEVKAIGTERQLGASRDYEPIWSGETETSKAASASD